VEPLKYFSLDFNQTIIKGKNKLTINGTYYYSYLKNRTVTHIIKPYENITIIDNEGKIRTYDFKDNTVVDIDNNIILSSERSYFWYFINGKSHDFDIPSNGYIISEFKKEGNYNIYKYKPLMVGKNKVNLITNVKKDNIPIFLEFSESEKKSLIKIYFKDYIKVDKFSIPSTIVEISFTSKKDSTIVLKKYNNLKLNEDVNLSILNFTIPSNAKYIEIKKK
jgi:outer membrane lipoprotein-sorting protein